MKTFKKYFLRLCALLLIGMYFSAGVIGLLGGFGILPELEDGIHLWHLMKVPSDIVSGIILFGAAGVMTLHIFLDYFKNKLLSDQSHTELKSQLRMVTRIHRSQEDRRPEFEALLDLVEEILEKLNKKEVV